MALFGGRKKKSIGIDIGTSSIKIVELTSSDGSRIELTNYGEYETGVGSALHASSVKLSAVETASIIKQVMREAKIAGVEAAMSVPIFSGFSTTIFMPTMPDAELEQAVAYEAKKYIPLPLSEVQFEWVRTNNDVADKKAKAEILIVAVTNELIDKYNNIAKLSDFTLKYLELDIFSLARALLTDEDAQALIINIGSQITILSITSGLWPVFTRTIDFSGAEFSKLLSSSLGIDFLKAEEMKKKLGVNAGEGILMPLLDSIFMESKKVISEWASRNTNQTGVRKVIISGGSSMMPGLLDYAKKIFGENVAIGFPFHDIIYPKVLEPVLKEIAPQFAVAVGLALRDFR